MSTARQYYQSMFSTILLPCIEACEWAEGYPRADTAQLLAHAKSTWRAWVGSSTTNQAILAVLALDIVVDVRYSVAASKYTSTQLLEVLANDEHPDVRNAAKSNIYSRTH